MIFCKDIPHNTRKGSGKYHRIPITPRFNLNFPLKRPIFKNRKGGSLVLGIEFFDDFWHGHPSYHKERIWKVSYNSDHVSISFEFSAETCTIFAADINSYFNVLDFEFFHDFLHA